jgi:hypothetical protein
MVARDSSVDRRWSRPSRSSSRLQPARPSKERRGWCSSCRRRRAVRVTNIHDPYQNLSARQTPARLLDLYDSDVTGPGRVQRGFRVTLRRVPRTRNAGLRRSRRRWAAPREEPGPRGSAGREDPDAVEPDSSVTCPADGYGPASPQQRRADSRSIAPAPWRRRPESPCACSGRGRARGCRDKSREPPAGAGGRAADRPAERDVPALARRTGPRTTRSRRPPGGDRRERRLPQRLGPRLDSAYGPRPPAPPRRTRRSREDPDSGPGSPPDAVPARRSPPGRRRRCRRPSRHR